VLSSWADYNSSTILKDVLYGSIRTSKNTMARFYFNFRDNTKQAQDRLLRSFLIQTISQSKSFPRG